MLKGGLCASIAKSEGTWFEIPKESSECTSSMCNYRLPSDGTVAGMKCKKLKHNSGAQQTVVRHALILNNAYTDQYMLLKGPGGKDMKLPPATIELVIGSQRLRKHVAMIVYKQDDGLLEIDLPNFCTLMMDALRKIAAEVLALTRQATSLATASELDTSDVEIPPEEADVGLGNMDDLQVD